MDKKQRALLPLEPEWQHFSRCLDVGYAYRLARRMEEFRTNPVLGYRTAGSLAERQTGDMLFEEMARIGLDPSREKFPVDGWEFKRARLFFQDDAGLEHACELGGYQTELHTGGRKRFKLVYAGQGTARELEKLDLKGKLALITINQRDEWWINYPTYQAHLHGAAAVLAVQRSGYGEESAKTLNAQDICGPKEAPALSLSQRDAKSLMAALSLSFGEEADVMLDAESTVTENTFTHNIVGYLPGEEKESLVILSAHYDSYFSGFQDDNTAVSLMLGLARTVVESGYKPRKTLVFCAMAAEEWGAVNTRYDWSVGAYNQITRLRPEWVGRAVVNINLELPAHAHGKKHYIRSVYELKGFLKRQLKALPPKVRAVYPKGSGVVCPTQTWSDDFSMAIAGVPAMVNEFGGSSFMETRYHSQFDNGDVYDEAVYHYHHILYGRLMLAFDQSCLPPLDFSVRLKALGESLTCQRLAPRLEGSLRKKLSKAVQMAEELRELTEELNRRYALALGKANGDAQALYRQSGEARKALLAAFGALEDRFVRLTWHDTSIFPHENAQENLNLLHQAVWQLHAGDVRGAIFSLGHIDNNCYAVAFDREVFNYFTGYVLNQPPQRLLWGAGRLMGHRDLYDLIHRLKAKAKQKKPDLALEIHEMTKLEQGELNRLEKTVREEAAAMAGLEPIFKTALHALRPLCAPQEEYQVNS